MKESLSFWGIRCVWMRYFSVYRKSVGYALVTTFAEPLLYLFSFGFGMGSLIGQISVEGMQVPYRRFILAGMLGQALLTQGFFEASYGGFVRMYYQRIFKAMALTPVTLSEVLWAELLWGATKGSFAAFAILLIGVSLGDFSLMGALIAVPVCFLTTFLFGALGLFVAAVSDTIEQIAYPMFLFVIPMFLFCGVYYPLATLPPFLQVVAWALPLTPVVSLLRSLVLGFPFHWYAIPLILVWLVTMTVVSRRSMLRRLVK